MVKSIRLTQGDYWDAGYAGGESPPLTPNTFRHLNDRRLLVLLESMSLAGKSILEVGAGNSAVLSYLARRYGDRARFSGLDYSQEGCRLLLQRAAREGASVQVHCQDMFEPQADLIGRFNAVYSLGVVEHFTDLSAVLRAKARFLAPGGSMLSVIPNLAGVLGRLGRRFNPRVYELHVPHNLESFIDGHRRAGLSVTASGFICSTNFGALSSCFNSPQDPGYQVYRWLSRLTKCLWWGEARFGDLPHTPFLSPYLYAICYLPS